ncbi:MAG: DNA-binding protein [FCB group bacterium]|jgi:predicted DNA-binding transcriptional regulator AlpA|nr:DNA-binding protein [FCB group bacterium]
MATENTQHTDSLVDEKTAARMIGMSVPWLRMMRQQGSTSRVKAIPFIRLGRAVRYETSALREYVAAHRVVR